MVSPGEAPSYGRRDPPESETRRVPMKRLPLVLSATALVVAVFGSTPVGHAVGSAIPAFAKSAGYAKQAGNASALNGIKASKQPRPGMLVPLGADGKFPASVGLVGPAGPKGDKGDKGATGPSWAGRPEGRHRTGGPRRCGAALAGRVGSVAGRTSRRGRVPLGRVLQDRERRLPGRKEGARRRCRRRPPGSGRCASSRARRAERRRRVARLPSRTTRRTTRHRSTSGRSARA